MVAITTDTHEAAPVVAPPAPSRFVPRAARPQPACGGQPAVPRPAGVRLVAAVLAVVVVVAVGVGTAAFGRLLDAERGIPSSPAAAADDAG